MGDEAQPGRAEGREPHALLGRHLGQDRGVDGLTSAITMFV